MIQEQVRFTALESARLIGDVEPAFVEEVITGLYDKRLAYHGIKRLLLVDRVRKGGVAPNCHDTYPWASFWTSGTKIFNGLLDGFTSFDTSFFHYSHASSPKVGDSIVMAAALARQDVLAAADPDITDGVFNYGYFAVREHIQPDGLTLVEVSAPRDLEADPRTNAANAERVMLGALHRIATE